MKHTHDYICVYMCVLKFKVLFKIKATVTNKLLMSYT